LPLIFIFTLSSGFVWIFRSADLRNRLDDSVFNTVSSRTFQAVENYFNPLLELVSASVLWGRIGAIDTIGEPDDYIELLENKLESVGTISTFSMSDNKGQELVIRLENGQEKDWYTE